MHVANDMTDWPNVEGKSGWLEYKPNIRSRKYRKAFYRPLILRQTAEPDGVALCQQYGYYKFRYTAGNQLQE
jgi:hypothetical protein